MKAKPHPTYSDDYIARWPYEEDLSEPEEWPLDCVLPYELAPFWHEHLKSLGCVTMEDVYKRVTVRDRWHLHLFLSPSPLGLCSDTSSAAEFVQVCYDLELSSKQILDRMLEAAEGLKEEMAYMRAQREVRDKPRKR